MKRTLLILWGLATAVSAQFSFNYVDPEGSGFFSNIERAPEGGNSGTTLGEQRRLALEQAAAIWDQFLVLNGPVEIEAEFSPQECSPASGVLASASPADICMNFSGAPEQNVWYVAALANHLSGSDLSPNDSEILVFGNTEIDEDPTCLGGTGFYYGFDGNSGSQIDFVRVMVHELGHGLGFFSLSGGAGTLPFGLPDIFTKNILDLERNETWDELTVFERASSAVGGGFAVFNGRSTQLAAKNQVSSGITYGRVDVVLGDEEIQSFVGTPASFGPSFPVNGITANVVLVDDGVANLSVTDACEPIVNADEVAGNIALIDRGTCFFTEKILAAEAAGAIAVVIANNIPDDLITMSGTAPFADIPSLFVTQATGQTLRTLPVGTEVTVKLEPNGGTFDGRPFIYTPTTFNPGSSVSHMDVLNFPNLLMEPFITTNREDPDLALTVMRDLGWELQDLPFPSLDYELWEQLNVTGVTGRTADSDGDGVDNFTEYAFASSPEDPQSVPSSIELDVTGTLAEITFLRTDQAADLDFQVLSSDDLQEFEPQEASSGELIDAGVDLAEETFSMDLETKKKFFQIQAVER